MINPANSLLSSACLLLVAAILNAGTVTAQTASAPAPEPSTEGAPGPDEGEDEECTLSCDCVTWLLAALANGGVATDGAHYQSVPVPHPVATGLSMILCALECISISGGEGSGCEHLDTDEASEPGGFV